MRVNRRLAVYFGLVLLLLGGRQSVLAQNEPGVLPDEPRQSSAELQRSRTRRPRTSTPRQPLRRVQRLAGDSGVFVEYPSVIPVVPPPLPADAYGSTINPYPQISPYDYSYQNDTNVGGIWEHTERTRDRKYYFNADFLFMSTKPPQGIFGNPNAQTYVRQERDFIDSPRQPGSSSGSSSGSGSGSGTSPAPMRQPSSCRTRVLSPTRRLTSHRWPTTTTHSTLGTEGNLISEGARFTTGWWNPDNSGIGGRLLVRRQGDGRLQRRQTTSRRHPDDTERAGADHPVPAEHECSRSRRLTRSPAYDPALNTNKLTPDTNPRAKPAQPARASGRRQHGARPDHSLRHLFRRQNNEPADRHQPRLLFHARFIERKWISVTPSVGVTYLNIRESLELPRASTAGCCTRPRPSEFARATTAFPIATSRPSRSRTESTTIRTASSTTRRSPEAGPSSSTSSSSGSSGSSTSSASLFTLSDAVRTATGHDRHQTRRRTSSVRRAACAT